MSYAIPSTAGSADRKPAASCRSLEQPQATMIRCAPRRGKAPYDL